jgi:hypothetical protein
VLNININNFNIVLSGLDRPLGAFYVIDENEAQKIANIYFV